MSESDKIETEVREGDILAGKYRVEQVLGQGGMGVVVAATHIVLQNRVALKFLLPTVAKHQLTATRFLREAQAAVKIKSQHVARVIDVGQMEDTGSPYMVMEYLDGRDLGAILEAEGPLDVERACLFVLQTCEALAAAHAAGIIHRDIKPANLFVTPGPDGQPMVKVLDFGISKNTVEMGTSNLTQTQTSMGSPLYMSPEQMRSARDVDARTDLWSLGVVLFEALTGHTPFEADTMPQLVALVLEEDAPRVDIHRQGLPPEIVEAVARCLQKDRNLRYQHVAQLAEAIGQFVPRMGSMSAERTSRIISTAGLGRTVEVLPSTNLTGKDLDVGAVVPPPKLSGTSTSFGRTGGGSSIAGRRVSPLALVGAAGVLVGLGALGMVLFTGPSETGAAAAPTMASEPPVATQAVPEPPIEKAPVPSVVSSTAPQVANAEASVAAPEASASGAGEVAEPGGKGKAPKGPKSPVKKKSGSDPFDDRF